MASLLIAGGRVIGASWAGGPEGGFGPAIDADVAIQDGVIREIGPGLSAGAADTVIDASGCLVVPGLIDPHVHLREPGGEHKETLETGGRAAVAGGFTTVCCMPNTTPALDSPEMVGFIAHRAAQTAACRIFTVAAATRGRRGEELTEIGLLARAGAVGISDDGDCVASAGLMGRVLGACREAELAFMQHCQEPTMTRGASMHAGEVAVRLGLTGWSRAAEEVIIERDVRLNAGIGAWYHVQHISSGGSVEIVRRARAAGQPVTAEAARHHLLLTHAACEGYDTAAKMNPPLREQSDVDAIRAGVADGTITMLATDHAPHAPHEKGRPFEDAPFGIIGLETALPLYAEALVTTGAISWERLVELMTIEPARLCGLDARGLGSLAVGGPGDVTVIDPEMEWVLDGAALAGMSRNTPFLGRRVRGRAVATVVGGAVKFEA